MKKINTYIGVFIVLLSVLLLVKTLPVSAQDVEVDFNALKSLDHYTPPPMFNGQSHTSTPPAKEIMSERTVTPTPTPTKKPKHAKAKTTKTSYVQPLARAVPVENVESAPLTPPIPKVRPKRLSVSKSYIDRIRKQHNLPPLNKESEEEKVFEETEIYITAPSPYEDETQSTIQIKEADVRDVLASIDPTVELPPKRHTPEPEKKTKQRIYAEPLPSLNNNTISLPFNEGESQYVTLPTDIVELIISKHTKQPNQKIEIKAYASLNRKRMRASKKLALKRALEVRDLLIANHVSSNVIDVLPIGSSSDNQKVNKVDIVFVDQSSEEKKRPMWIIQNLLSAIH